MALLHGTSNVAFILLFVSLHILKSSSTVSAEMPLIIYTEVFKTFVLWIQSAEFCPNLFQLLPNFACHPILFRSGTIIIVSSKVLSMSAYGPCYLHSQISVYPILHMEKWEAHFGYFYTKYHRSLYKICSEAHLYTCACLQTKDEKW